MTDEFCGDFCIAGFDRAVEFWRSGGATGKPLFYPRSAQDMRYMLGVSFRRIWPCIGAGPGDVVHVAFPMGIHPVGQLTPRSAEMEGLATVWAGSGTTTPSDVQLELILSLKPSIVAAMPSYALHLANLAEARGIDLAASSVSKVLVSAEPLTDAKRAKLARSWGAPSQQLVRQRGAMTSVERHGLGAMAAWTDLFCSKSGQRTWQAGVIGDGRMVITRSGQHDTPFSSGSIHIVREAAARSNIVLASILEHALRTEGFFKVRGVNINHGDLEDFMFAQTAIQDFKGEAVTAADGQDRLLLFIEVRRGANPGLVVEELVNALKQKFEQTCVVEILETGTLAREFEKSVKAPRFIDRR